MTVKEAYEIAKKFLGKDFTTCAETDLYFIFSNVDTTTPATFVNKVTAKAGPVTIEMRKDMVKEGIKKVVLK